MVQEYGIKGYNIMCGVHKRNHGKYERSPFTEMEEVHKSHVELSLNKILDLATITRLRDNQAYLIAEPEETRRDNEPSFIMVVWNGYGEFEAMASAFPSIARKISDWVDLSDIVVNMSGSASDRRPYSLRNVMLSLGFGAEYSQKLSRGHSAGMDAVRTNGVLLALCSKSATDRLAIRRHGEEARRCRKLWEVRPAPYENFPFTTIVTTAEGVMPRTLWYNQNLFNHICPDLGTTEPTAVAVCPRSRKKKPRTHAWVCFGNAADRDRFVEEWNGRRVGDMILQVTAILPPVGTVP